MLEEQPNKEIQTSNNSETQEVHNTTPRKKGLFISKRVLLIVVAVVGVTALGAGVFALIGSKSDNSSGNKDNGMAAQDNSWTKGCSGDDKVTMSHMPMDMKDVQTIAPAGLVVGAHVTPIDHLYFYPVDMQHRDAAPVYAMADGKIIEISKREVNVDSGTSRPAEYRVIMQHSCQTVSYFDLLTSLDDSIKSKAKGLDGGYANNLDIPIKAGQIIGRVGAQSLDTAIYNFSMTLPGFLSPDLYKGEFWKVHTDDFFSYFEGSNKTDMLAKNIRKVEPYAGKIDYDQAGKLIGNWFLDGTDYSGDGSGAVSEDGKHGYWSGHLSVNYFAIDPTIIIISIGEYGDGSPQAFAVKGNAPDPATVDKSSGLTAYELTQAPQFTPTGSISKGSGQVVGTVLFQVMDGEKLKFEAFPGKTKSQVSEFTADAKTYYR